MRPHSPKIVLDLDRDRIQTVLREAYGICQATLSTSFDLTVDEFVAKIEPYLQSNRVTCLISFDLNNKKYPGLTIDVDLRKASVFARIPSRARNHPMQVELNRYLKGL